MYESTSSPGRSRSSSTTASRLRRSSGSAVMNESRSATMSGFQWVKWVSAQVKRSWWESGVRRASCVEFGVDLAAARLDAQDVDQLLVGLDESRLEGQGPADRGLGLPDAAKLAMEPAGQQMGLGGDGMRIRDPAERTRSVVILPSAVASWASSIQVQAGPGPKPLELPERPRADPSLPARNARSASAQSRSGSGRSPRSDEQKRPAARMSQAIARENAARRSRRRHAIRSEWPRPGRIVGRSPPAADGAVSGRSRIVCSPVSMTLKTLHHDDVAIRERESSAQPLLPFAFFEHIDRSDFWPCPIRSIIDLVLPRLHDRVLADESDARVLDGHLAAECDLVVSRVGLDR